MIKVEKCKDYDIYIIYTIIYIKYNLKNLATICHINILIYNIIQCTLHNTDSVDEMINDIQAIFHHSISTDENPQHSYCPKGEYSWCKYNKYMHEKAKNSNTDMPLRKHRGFDKSV